MIHENVEKKNSCSHAPVCVLLTAWQPCLGISQLMRIICRNIFKHGEKSSFVGQSGIIQNISTVPIALNTSSIVSTLKRWMPKRIAWQNCQATTHSWDSSHQKKGAGYLTWVVVLVFFHINILIGWQFCLGASLSLQYLQPTPHNNGFGGATGSIKLDNE